MKCGLLVPKMYQQDSCVLVKSKKSKKCVYQAMCLVGKFYSVDACNTVSGLRMAVPLPAAAGSLPVSGRQLPVRLLMYYLFPCFKTSFQFLLPFPYNGFTVLFRIIISKTILILFQVVYFTYVLYLAALPSCLARCYHTRGNLCYSAQLDHVVSEIIFLIPYPIWVYYFILSS